jgi:N-acetylneuraminate lyase
MTHFNGLIAAPFAPLGKHGSLNLSIIKPYVEHLLADGVKGLFICGSNGEGPNLTIKQRMQVAEEFVRQARQRMKIFIHVGHTSITESRSLASHAQEIRADAISSVAAFYFKPASVLNLVNCMADIAAAAPALPYYYYHIPHLTGVGMSMTEFLWLAEGQIPSLAGIKYTATTLHEYQACLGYAQSKYDILYGNDEMLLPALAVGATGAIGSTYNFAAPLYLEVITLFSKGHLEAARAMQAYLVEVVRIILQFPAIPAQKAVMKLLGLDLGPCLLPLENLTPEQHLEIQIALDNIQFFEKLAELKAMATL